ncbi:uncharacterized protein Tco025E_01669 [Trypanosoma conorhini]|uniref:Uncharacterized protein n=1 Tax=Trypanosoma conorhini TaxID=83891 RepID=A0A3R7NS42_9TRYP|nr:uncharacterized protein Tco025E_01669 [Trypanosoma conorhini]RNF26205.1 hypothetical protein Tco025E_01669 [Trypanosoma conorhini]
MADFAAFREFQARSSIVVERERAVDLRRRMLQELTQNVQQLTEECRRREEQLQPERLRFAQRRAAQDEKVGAKEAQGQAQRERVAALDAEETRLRAAIAEREEEMQRVHGELQQRQSLSVRLQEAKGGLTRLKCQLEEWDAKVMKLETRTAKMEMTAEKRHAALAERLPAYDMPQIEAERGGALEDIAGESILLVDEFNQ